MTLVEFLGKALKHGVIVDGHFGQAVPVQEQEIFIPVHLNGLCASAVLQHTLKRFIRGCAHRHLPKSAVSLGRFDVVAVLCASQKLVVYIDKTQFKVQIGFGQAAKLGNPKPCFQQDHNLVIILGVHGIALHEFQEFFFLRWGERHLWFCVVVDYIIDREVEWVFADAIVLNSHIKNCFQRTLAVADGVIGYALFLHTQCPLFRVGQLHTVNAGRPQIVVRQKFHQLLAALFRPTLHVSPLPDILGIKLADRHFLADGVDPVGNVLLYLLDFLTQRNVGAFPGRDFVGGY